MNKRTRLRRKSVKQRAKERRFKGDGTKITKIYVNESGIVFDVTLPDGTFLAAGDPVPREIKCDGVSLIGLNNPQKLLDACLEPKYRQDLIDRFNLNEKTGKL